VGFKVLFEESVLTGEIDGPWTKKFIFTLTKTPASMAPKNASFSNPKKLQTFTSVLTVFAYVLYASTVYLAFPYLFWYITLFVLGVNIMLIGLLFYLIEQRKNELDLRKSRFSAVFRLLINLIILAVALYRMGIV
jgi:hypothetical protein